MRVWVGRVALGVAMVASAGLPAVQNTTDLIALSVPGRTNATPSIAALDRFVVITWGGSVPDAGTDVYCAVSRDDGRTFGAPVRVNDLAGDARLNGEQPPHVVLAPRAGHDPVVTVVWTSRRPAGTALLRSQSLDGGRSFSRATVVPGSDAPGNRGWEAVATDRGGRVSVAWLDHRELEPKSPGAPMATMTHGDHAAGSVGDGTAAAQPSKLYVASLDGTVAPRAITGGVCYCCKTAMAVGKDGTMYVAWRHVYPGDVRDIAFVASRDGGKTFSEPRRVSADGWALNGCPENGPAMVVDDRNSIHVVWPTLVEASKPALGLFYAASTDGRTFAPRRRIPTAGTPAHAQLTLDQAGGLVLVWDELKDGTRQIKMSRRAPTGPATDFAAPVLLSSAPGGSYPVAASVSGAVLVAWAGAGPDASVIRVRRVPQ